MILQSKRHKIDEVFTPRQTSVNKSIYVERPELEKELKRALKGTLHALVYGESGSGKSWLCKKVLDDLNAHYITANCANASRLGGSLTQEIYNAAIPSGTAIQQSYSEGKGGGANVAVATASLSHTKNFHLKQEEPLLAAFKKIREEANSKNKQLAVIVVDNLESIFSNPDTMSELADMIILLDDQRYAEYSIKFVIVGVPSDVIEYFAKVKNVSTVSNRIQEISEITSLSKSQVYDLVDKGFVDLLKSDIPGNVLENWKSHVYSVTLGIAQRVHEYCLQLAYCLEENSWKGEDSHLEQADILWLKGGLKQAYQVIESHMNKRETKNGRRNQVLYALSKVNSRTFNVSEIEEIVRIQFPNSTRDVTLGISQIIASDLSGGNHPITKQTSPKSTTYAFVDPRYLMCLRAALKKEGEKIVRCEVY